MAWLLGAATPAQGMLTVLSSMLLLDEPSNGLDADARLVLARLLQEKSADAVVFISCHDQAFAQAIGATVIEFEALQPSD